MRSGAVLATTTQAGAVMASLDGIPLPLSVLAGLLARKLVRENTDGVGGPVFVLTEQGERWATLQPNGGGS